MTVTQEELGDMYHFFNMDTFENYKHTEMHKVILRLEYIFNTQL